MTIDMLSLTWHAITWC